MFRSDNKEKFIVIHIDEFYLTELSIQSLQTYIKSHCQDFKMDVCINLENINSMTLPSLEGLIVLQENFKSAQRSCYFYGLNEILKEKFENQDILSQLQHVNTSSEAWDMVQFEILERELLL